MNLRLAALAALLISLRAGAQPIPPAVVDAWLNPVGTNIALPFPVHGDAIHLSAGFSGEAGSFAALSWKSHDLFGFGETTSLSVEAGVRLRRIEWGVTRRAAFGTPWTLGVTTFVGRFHFNQEKESSLSAFDRDIPQYLGLQYLDDAIDYTSTAYGFTAWARRNFHGGLSHFDLVYGYDVSSVRPVTAASQDYFAEFKYLGVAGPNRLSGIRTSRIVPSWTWNAVDNPSSPARGSLFTVRATVAGPGGDVHMIEPAMEVRHYRRGIRGRDVIALRARARLLSGYGGRSAPPYDRYYMGGEDDVRGLSSWSASPVVFMPDEAVTPDLHADGTPVIQKVLIDNVLVSVPVYQSIPIYRLIAPGGDTNVVANAEYRAAIRGPFTLVLFADLGLNRIVFADQLRLNADFINRISTDFLQAGFENRFSIAPGMQRARMSTGVELRVRVPKTGVPVRFYWAWNPRVYKQYIQPPVVIDRSSFANNASFFSAVYTYAEAPLFEEHRNVLRFSIGRTF